jgi:hypothetical protein
VNGRTFASGYAQRWSPPVGQNGQVANPLEAYFESISTGPGVWKWRHYFDAYHRHFARFVGREVHMVEVGIYSGGSLPMWRHYFGPLCHVYGTDIEPTCAAHAGPQTKVFIGDQADRSFWAKFRVAVPRVDILLDDGGHTPEQQRITLEEMLPHIAPGGVYVCEDIHGTQNDFTAFVHGLTHELGGATPTGTPKNEPGLACEPSAFQRSIASVHHYPFLTFIEKRPAPLEVLFAPKHGTQWQPG